MSLVLRSRWFLGGALFALGWACGCGGKGGSGETAGETASDGGTVSATPVASDQFSAQLADAWCTNIAGCCRAAGEPFDPTGCVKSVDGEVAAIIRAGTASGRVLFDSAAAGVCIKAYGAGLAACTDQNLWDSIQDSCSHVFVGTVPLGGMCAQGSECASPDGGDVACVNHVCATPSSTSPFDLPHAKVGEPCSSTCEQYSGPGGVGSCGGAAVPNANTGACWVNDNVLCGADGTCHTTPHVGEPCVDFHCGGDGFCKAGACVARLTTGACPQGDECAQGYRCDSTTRQCVALKADGQPCGGANECAGGQCGRGTCRAWTVATTNRCAGLVFE